MTLISTTIYVWTVLIVSSLWLRHSLKNAKDSKIKKNFINREIDIFCVYNVMFFRPIVPILTVASAIWLLVRG